MWLSSNSESPLSRLRRCLTHMATHPAIAAAATTNPAMIKNLGIPPPGEPPPPPAVVVLVDVVKGSDGQPASGTHLPSCGQSASGLPKRLIVKSVGAVQLASFVHP